MQLVMPMAGLGQRFADAGYTLPKPLIPVDGLPMFARAVSDLPACERMVFVVHREHVRRFEIDRVIRRHFENATVVVAPELTAGQACSVQLGAREIEPDQPVLVAACDNTHLYDVDLFTRQASDPSLDCLIWTYRHDFRVLENPSAYGWVRTMGDTSLVVEVSCKRPISDTLLHDHVVSGTFWFRSAKAMIDGIDALVASDIRINHEFYLDVVPNMLISRGNRVDIFEVEKYIGWGTPADLADYQRWERYFATRHSELVASH